MSDKFTFQQVECAICHQQISKGGAAYTSHMRAHVRKGEALEFKQGKHLRFMPAKDHESFLQTEPYAKLGDDPLPGQPKGVWEIPSIAANLGNGIIPAEYFTTSGEAVKKAEKLTEDAYALAVKARAFRDKLRKTRGVKKYLETAREAGRLLVKTKEPRPKGDKVEGDE